MHAARRAKPGTCARNKHRPGLSRRFRAVAGLAVALLAAWTPGGGVADEGPAPSSYRVPPEPIPSLLTAPGKPTAIVAPGGKTVALLGRNTLPPIADFAGPVLGLAGHRIDPATNGPASGRVHGLTSVTFVDVASGAKRRVELPEPARLIAPRWSPDGSRLAFLAIRERGIELWVADAATGTARALTAPVVNAAFRNAYEWLPDGSGLIATVVPADRGPPPDVPPVPTGPVVRESFGRVAPAPTYQNLLRNRTDEALFEHYFTSTLAEIPLDGTPPRAFGEAGLISDFSIAPGGEYLLQTRVLRPYSWSLPAAFFPAEVIVTDRKGRRVHTVARRPLQDGASGPGVAAGEPRAIEWRSDAPATLVWAETVEHGGERVYLLAAPFDGRPELLVELDARFSDIAWGRPDLALVTAMLPKDGMELLVAVDPAKPGESRVLRRRNFRTGHDGGGRPMIVTNARGMPVLHLAHDGKAVFAQGSDAGRAYVARLDLETGDTQRIWEAEPSAGEEPLAVLDNGGRTLLTWRESRSEPPNLHVVDVAGRASRALTSFADPAPAFAHVGRRRLAYTRADGVRLGGTLYTPAGYDAARDGPLPLLMWAYPTEHRDAGERGTPSGSANRFVRPHGVSPLLLLARGYAVLYGPGMPVIGKDGAAPNDGYVEQLVMNAEAAVRAVVDAGVAAPDAIAIGGHSYGASMVANLLAHTDLFRTGIALSGAYNRTLTPFGFQTERRNYWEAPDTYRAMSAFTHADRIDEPLLLLHGSADSNSGTLPMQSERFYDALKGTGGAARLVVLPLEGHSYHARESVLHALWEITCWLDRHLRGLDLPCSP